MRGWNFFVHIQEMYHLTLLAYLWGIETLNIKKLKFYCLEVISLPMRDWNSKPELDKLLKELELLAYLWGIETGFETSDENAAIGVISLPMRDWNKNRLLRSHFSLELLAYLWGIET